MHNDGNFDTPEVYRRRRRARDDPMERNYVCNCGKSYLSYPALYTHMKNKHQGRAPQPSEVALMRLNEQQRAPTIRDQPENQYDKHLTCANDALVCVINTFKPYCFAKQLNYTLEEIFLLFPLQLKKCVLESANILFNDHSSAEKSFQNGLKAVSIDWIMGRFVVLLLHKIDKNLLEELVFILLVFRQYLNVTMSLMRVETNIPQKQYTQEASGMKMIDHMNQFLLYYFNRHAKQYRILLKQTCFINRQNRQFICLTKFLFLFSRWAFLQRYTNSKIRLNNF